MKGGVAQFGPPNMCIRVCVYPCVRRLLEVEVSGWRNELRLRVFDGRHRRRHPHVEVFQPAPGDGEDGGPRLADGRWHTVSVELSSAAPGGGGGGSASDDGFYVRVHVDCVLAGGRRVDHVQLPWSPADFDGLSYLWIGQKSATGSVIQASRPPIFYSRLPIQMP